MGLKLRAMSDLPAPCVPASEISGARWLPEHRHRPPRLWAKKIPLSAAVGDARAKLARSFDLTNRPSHADKKSLLWLSG